MKRVLYFTAAWCGPCQMMAPMIAELSAQFNIEKIDVDNDPNMSAQYSIRSIPTFIILDPAGNEVIRKVGAMSKQALLNLLV
jgi:thioredoxin 1